MIGVVADDTTGANDIGLMFSKNHYSTKVVAFDKQMDFSADVDVLIIDTDSRLDSPEESYDKVFNATKTLQKLGSSLFFNKTCSVFRGNIGKEFDAMLDALNEDFAVISLAFPKNGRKTINGIHTVHGRLLELSEFAKDPVHPMRQSNLVEILQQQTARKVTLVPLEIVRKGPVELRKEIEKQREYGQYCIVDSENQSDLAILAEAIHDMPILCGSSAIAEELPSFINKELVQTSLEDLIIDDPHGVLVISGSLTPQTRSQTAHLMDIGTSAIILDSRKVFDQQVKATEIERVTREAISIIKSGNNALVMADHRQEIVDETKKLGKQLLLNEMDTSKMISAALAEAAQIIIENTGLRRLVVAGGDTSGTVCRRLGIKGNYVLEEIEAGLPSGLTLDHSMLIVLKSGSFGTPEFLEKAITHLKGLFNQNDGTR
ncbi:four-carbon acid sugar kinase family protein [Peribacillus sp. SCS-155]|uniref:four-carbon acid sugar kinase family protein n=1 Tax=Peribacillus sedimenti TaxID=3115297 RepID=UPI003906A8A8